MGDSDVETPEYDLYEDDDDGAVDRALDADEVTPEILDNYVGAEVQLPRGD